MSTLTHRKFALASTLVARYGFAAYLPKTPEWRAYWIAYRIWHSCWLEIAPK